jgi:hypothetical protein
VLDSSGVLLLFMVLFLYFILSFCLESFVISQSSVLYGSNCRVLYFQVLVLVFGLPTGASDPVGAG